MSLPKKIMVFTQKKRILKSFKDVKCHKRSFRVRSGHDDGVIRRQAFQAIRPSFTVIFGSFNTFPEKTKDLEETNNMKKKISRYLPPVIFLCFLRFIHFLCQHNEYICQFVTKSYP